MPCDGLTMPCYAIVVLTYLEATVLNSVNCTLINDVFGEQRVVPPKSRNPIADLQLLFYNEPF